MPTEKVKRDFKGFENDSSSASASYNYKNYLPEAGAKKNYAEFRMAEEAKR